MTGTELPVAEEEATEEADLPTRIVEGIREDSKNGKLTSRESLGAVAPELTPDMLEVTLAEMAQNQEYGDIRRIVASTGAEYFYSDKLVSGSYAKILLRAEEKDSLATVAATVREDSRIYPRPTNFSVFKESVFGIEAEELETLLSQLSTRSEYQDIKKIVASTGAVYLFSSLHLNAALARAQVEYEEVELEENP